MKVLGLIPARGGSKGIPGKNIKLLAGKPLIEYTIDAALNARLITDVVVSTDSPEIAEISRKLGAQVPFIRPASLALDTTGSIEVVCHAVKLLYEGGYEYDVVCLLQPTSPFRKPGFIDEAIELFSKSDYDSLISVLPLPEKFNPHWIFEECDNNTLKIATGEKEIIKRRQDLPKAFYRDGSLYLTRSSVIISKKSLYGNTIGYIVSDPLFNVNIDTPEDWLLAEKMAEKLTNK